MKYLIMHGSYGSPEENWFRWLEQELKKIGSDVILEQFPTDDWDEVNRIGRENITTYTPVQSRQTWENFFIKTIDKKLGNEPFVYVGHSIAPVFTLHMLQKFDYRLASAIFVAPFFDIPDRPEIWQFYPVNKTFYGYDFDFGKIRKQIGKSFVVYGDDDPYVPASEPPLFAEKLGSEVIVVPKGGHCGSAFREFFVLLDLLHS